jgi:2-dehydro-3-deoxygalactonokinase
MDTLTAAPALVALDWGTSSLRAFLMTADGAVINRAASAHGIQNLPEPGVAGFERAFAEIAGPWLAARPDLPVVAGGMVGSAQGWREAPYVPCPAGPVDLAAAAADVTTADGHRILIAPGVLYDPPAAAPDVMRGEEIQIAGALVADPSWSAAARIVLPGTHSKWVEVADGRIVRFATYMTGELFAILRRHSILGRLMPDPAAGPTAVADEPTRRSAFATGVRAGLRDGSAALTHGLFAVRTLGLMKRMPNAVLEDYLSGLLIGHELAGAADPADPRPLILIGEGGLCRRYAEALAIAGVAVAGALDNTAPAGLYHFARAAGLVVGAPRHV